MRNVLSINSSIGIVRCPNDKHLNFKEVQDLSSRPPGKPTVACSVVGWNGPVVDSFFHMTDLATTFIVGHNSFFVVGGTSGRYLHAFNLLGKTVLIKNIGTSSFTQTCRCCFYESRVSGETPFFGTFQEEHPGEP